MNLRKNKKTRRRTILNIEDRMIDFGYLGTRKVRAVLWCLPDDETSRSYVTDDIRLTLICGASSSTEVRYFRRPIKVSKKDPIKTLEAYSERHWSEDRAYERLFGETLKGHRDFHGLITAIFSRICGGRRFEAEVIYANDSDHCQGELQAEFGRIGYYRCNFRKADSPHASLVSNIKLKRGDRVSFEVPNDPYTLYALGAVNLEVLRETV